MLHYHPILAVNMHFLHKKHRHIFHFMIGLQLLKVISELVYERQPHFFFLHFSHYRRKRRQFRGSTLHLQRSNAAISGSGDDVQHGVFSVADNPIFNNDQLNQSHWFREIHLQSSVSYPLTIKNSEIVKPPDYSEIDFKDQKSPPSYTEAMTAYSSK